MSVWKQPPASQESSGDIGLLGTTQVWRMATKKIRRVGIFKFRTQGISLKDEVHLFVSAAKTNFCQKSKL